MKIRKLLTDILNNIFNKSPKILMFIVILFLLGYQKSSYFGFDPNKKIVNIEIPIKDVCLHYGMDVKIHSQDNVLYDVVSVADGSKVGAIVSSANFADQYAGYAGSTPVIVYLDNDNIITGVQLLQNRESRNFIARISRTGFFDRWNGQHIAEHSNVDLVSGATMSSRSIAQNVEAALGAIIESKQGEQKQDFGTYIGTFAILAIIILSFISYLFPKQMRPIRVVLLLASIAVLGIWQGAFVSVQLLYNWAINGASWGVFGVVVLVCLAILVPLFRNKSFYCQYVCPFGAAQELIGKLTPKKQKISSRALQIFRWVRQLGLLGIVALLLFTPEFEPSNVEPFTIFMINSATLSVIIIAGVSLVGSLFVLRPWCRLLCPTGELLSLFQRRIVYRKNKSKRSK